MQIDRQIYIERKKKEIQGSKGERVRWEGDGGKEVRK